MEEVLRGHLLAHSAIVAAVSNRVYWGARPQNRKTLPAIVLHHAGDGLRGYVMEGPDGLVSSRVQADCWGKTFAEAKVARDALIAALSGAEIVDTSCHIQGCFIVSEISSFEVAEGKEAPERFHRVSLDFLIWHSE